MSQSSKALQGYRSFVQCMNAVERVEFEKLPSHERKRQYTAAKRFCQSNENFSVHDGDSSVGTTVPETEESPELNLSPSKGLSSQTEQEKTDLLRLEREQWTNRNVGENWLFDAIVDCEAFVSYERPLRPTISVFDEDFKIFHAFNGPDPLEEFIYFFVQYKRDSAVKEEIKLGSKMQQGAKKDILTDIFAIKFEDLPNPATCGLPELSMTVNLALNFISSVIAIWVPQTPSSVNLFKEMGFNPLTTSLIGLGK